MKKVTSLVALFATVSVAPAHAERDGPHDFDFEIGTWQTHLSRLVHPLSGSKTWVVYDGTTVVRKIWNGRANLVELEVRGPAGQIEALSLRLYDPEAHQWSLNFANSKIGAISPPPTIGAFRNGRGEFYDSESFNGKPIRVRFTISNFTANSCHFEQAYSDDGGKSWETNCAGQPSKKSTDRPLSSRHRLHHFSMHNAIWRRQFRRPDGSSCPTRVMRYSWMNQTSLIASLRHYCKQRTESFPLNRRRRLPRDVVDNTGDAGDFVHDA